MGRRHRIERVHVGCCSYNVGYCSLCVGCITARWAVSASVHIVVVLTWHAATTMLATQPLRGLFQPLYGMQTPLALTSTGEDKDEEGEGEGDVDGEEYEYKDEDLRQRIKTGN